MTKLFNDPAQFTEDMLVGFLDANARYVAGVPGGVVRAHKTRPGKVAVVIGGGSGHYPAFCGTVGAGFADGAVVGNIFTSPSAEEAASVARAAHGDAGVLLTTGNYAGDVMNFGLAVTQLRSEGIEAEYFAVTDDVASAKRGEETKRRGIAGDFTVFKCASAAAEEGLDLAGVVRVAEASNAATRTLGVAFDGCTMPGADHPLFTVPEGHMGLGLGIHGEPGVADEPMPSAADLAATLVDGVLGDRPDAESKRIAVILNGLGRTKYEELFVVWGTVSRLLRERGYTVVEPEVGELVTSLDMSGCSLTVMWLDEELEKYWTAPADTPAYRKGATSAADEGEVRTDAAADAATDTPAARRTLRRRRPPRRRDRGPCAGGDGGHAGRRRGRTRPHRRGRRRRRPRPRHGQGFGCGPRSRRPRGRGRRRARVRCSPRQARNGLRRRAAPRACCGARCCRRSERGSVTPAARSRRPSPQECATGTTR